MDRHTMRLKFKKGDCLAIGFVLFLTLFTAVVFRLFIQSANGSKANFQHSTTDIVSQTEGASPAMKGTFIVMIYQDGELVKELPLNEDTSFTLKGDYQNEIQILNGEVGIIKSDCPGADCVHSGRIHEPGRSIVCLPNRVELRVEGESDVDFIVN